MSKQIRPSQSYIDERSAKTLLEKWAPVLDYTSNNVGAIEDDHTRLNTAILLENQEKWCFEASNQSGGLGGVFNTGNVSNGAFGNQFPSQNDNAYAPGDARLPKILIPMIRRTFPELITNEIVGVQPMSGPVGLAFALRYKYEGQNLGSGAGGFSGDSSAGASQYNSANRVLSASNPELGYQYLNTAFTGASSSALSGLGAGSAFPIVDQDRGVAALLSQFELSSNIPQIVVSFEKTAVEAGTRRLAARWSVELEQDLKNMNGIDIDTELTNAMSYELQAEIDREMIIRMIQTALNAGYGTGFSVWSPASADGRWLVERNRDFYQRLIVEANRIAVRNRRGSANFIVATPRVCAILEMLPEFQWAPVQGSVNTQPVGVAKVGSLAGRFNVYRDTRTEAQFEASAGGNFGGKDGFPGAPANSTRSSRLEYALLGYKGPEFYDTGIIYCPYIPVMVQRTIGPNDFSPRVGLLTRYGVVDNIFGANLYYHVIILQGLGTAFTPATQSVYF
ncbi:major capsid protein [uncultured Caudovirales phage]|uniref:Major capsid protein n=1 Tax=uncultured Caudovirales phage TaxID=2100421 RepID=A0A6J7XC28_9CAUD|nr:major capsid protein [uncultured Caudovirales phage]